MSFPPSVSTRSGHASYIFSSRLTVMEYILKTRVMLAKGMLSSTDEPVLRVSEECGFSSVGYFCRAFKSEVGLTPLAYRKEKRKKPGSAK